MAFWPGGLHRLLDVPVQELFDFSVDSRMLLGPEVTEIDARLTEATDYGFMLNVVETYLLRRLRALRRPVRPIDRLLPELVTGQPLTVDEQASLACLSPRQYERSFRERVGMSPKLYARIVRFDRAFRLKEQLPKLDWLTVAIRTGYFDYRHLMRDFQAFAGVTPPRLLAAEASYQVAQQQAQDVGFLLPVGRSAGVGLP
ncbi:helix-turn-helix domain-containing protein [Hymenobacter sp. J193]|uniref:helix-turn-helix domain-containing protein n=1 Tax=Hymenobacter sp. J193 TaxID=2898429 RepID=UPI0021510F92|nr:helix-turn-helix domain-containing protein [Hymenobacter sp. J193]MCR5888020.1 helix-turn-helix domain-containing protein [Hymenobacter sp. J193]